MNFPLYIAKRYLFSKSSKNNNPFVLVLGIGRCGSTWIANTIAKSPSISTYYEEPFYKFKLPLILNSKIKRKNREHTAICYQSKAKFTKRLIMAINLLISAKSYSSIFLKNLEHRTVRKSNKNENEIRRPYRSNF